MNIPHATHLTPPMPLVQAPPTPPASNMWQTTTRRDTEDDEDSDEDNESEEEDHNDKLSNDLTCPRLNKFSELLDYIKN